ncbi:unnamed protein product [Owenia fusiformis]|uniref:15-oxoprostaglandin 13-reductase n=1 Tax=Owenia fusiformis TaxID=6347 RepID=A0A8J1XSA8_OWEFU|nr:unnamed protein product [Owenia fusiformis]
MASTVSKVPQTFRKWVVQKISNKFREAAEVVTVNTPQIGPSEVLVKNKYVGINASDINFTAGRYDPTAKPPFDAGFEAVGEVVARGDSCNKLNLGQPVCYMANGAFAEYMVLKERHVFPVPATNPEFVTLLVSGLTAAISLDKVGEIKKGETVLVTAAAGGTGQFAVQAARNAGCHVIGTCSSDDKVQFLKDIGCDRPVNYKKENLNEVLKNEYPSGVDVVYESIGGDMFDTAVKNLAIKGRLIIIGYIAGYETSRGFPTSKVVATLPQRLLPKSASVRGFFLFGYVSDFPEYLNKLVDMYKAGTLKLNVDNGQRFESGPFKGVGSIPNAIEYLYSGKSMGKIVVDVDQQASKL